MIKISKRLEAISSLIPINSKIIDLSQPLMTDEAKNDMDSMIDAPMDMDGRSIENLFKIVQEEGMIDLMNTEKFSTIFSPFYRIIESEKKMFQNFKKS